jgi:hypothetical protein
VTASFFEEYAVRDDDAVTDGWIWMGVDGLLRRPGRHAVTTVTTVKRTTTTTIERGYRRCDGLDAGGRRRRKGGWLDGG